MGLPRRRGLLERVDHVGDSLGVNRVERGGLLGRLELPEVCGGLPGPLGTLRDVVNLPLGAAGRR